MSKTHRLFVGNLPSNIVDQELQTEFSSYGTVRGVEVKHKRNTDNEIIKTFAFVLIEIDGHSLKQCLQEFKNEKYKGHFLNVTVARENFLDKLKREREEAAGNLKCESISAKDVKPATVSLISHLPSFTTTKVAVSDESSDDSMEDDSHLTEEHHPNNAKQTKLEVTDDLILRKKSKAFLENGKIKIDALSSSGMGPILVIDRNKKVKKSFDDVKALEADKRRMESLNKMKDTYNQQKLAIKQALAKVDASKSNKILFEATEPPARTMFSNPEITKAKGKSLFDDDEANEVEDYSNDFQIKEHYQGKKGGELLQLQSRFKNDKRFTMDARFLEENDDYEEADPVAEAPSQDNEREWQYGILEDVIGKRIQTEVTENKIKQPMLRYDPTKQEHTKYLAQNKRKAETPIDTVKSKKELKKVKMDNEDMINDHVVSSEQYYKVSKNLTSSLLRQDANQFSLLSMFGTAVNDNSTPTTKLSYRETLLATNKQKIVTDMSNPFKYDTSDEEDELQQLEEKKSEKVDNKNKTNKMGTKVWHESFFIFGADDQRLKDGLSFFLPTERIDADGKDIANKQKEMRNIIKKKIKRSIKSALPHGAKPNKRFRKFVRNL